MHVDTSFNQINFLLLFFRIPIFTGKLTIEFELSMSPLWLARCDAVLAFEF